MHKHNLGQTLKSQSSVATLNIRSMSSNLINAFPSPMYLCKFGGENPTGSEDRNQKSFLRMITLKIR